MREVMGMKLLKRAAMLAMVFVLLLASVPAMAAQKGGVSDADELAAKIYGAVNKSRVSVQSAPEGAALESGRVIVKLKDGASLDWPAYGVVPLKSGSLGKRDVYIADAGSAKAAMALCAKLAKDSAVEYAQPDYTFKSEDITPNDEYYTYQWGLQKINIPKAWNITKGSPAVTVAVIDSGVDAGHPDLKGRVLPGYDFVNNDADPSDDEGHGTMVAGVIAAVADNGIGVAGVDQGCKILPVKAADSDGNLDVSSMMQSIYYAADHGADVINMSFGSPMYVLALKPVADAITEAAEKGIVLVAASGNGDPVGTEVSFPALYAPVIAVGASDEYDQTAYFSNYGAPLDLLAPGMDIVSVYSKNGARAYARGDGTSLATPFVSGVASLLLAKNPALTPSQIEYLIEASAAKPSDMNGAEWDEYYGYGRLDAYAALKQQLPDTSRDVADDMQHAQRLYSGQNVAERIDLPLDIDCYEMDVDSTGSVSVNITPPAPLDIAAAVLDANGNVVYTANNAPVGEPEKFSFNASAGTYYLAVLDVDSHWSATPYTLSLSGPLGSVPAENSQATGSPVPGRLFLNSYYGISSYSEKDYAAASSQVALAWSEIRSSNGVPYFSEKKNENNRIYDYGVPDGDIQSLISGMRSSGAKLMLSVYLGDKSIMNSVLASPNSVISQMTSDFGIKYYNYSTGATGYVSNNKGGIDEYDGLIVDFEGLTSSQASAFNSFLDKLKAAMPPGKQLCVCVQPRDTYTGYDYAYIGRVADQVILMAHDYESTRATEPASAPYDRVKAAVQYAVSQIPAQKLLLQVSLSPVQWQYGSPAPVTPTYSAMKNAIFGKNVNETVLDVTPIGQRHDSLYDVGYAYLERKKADGTQAKDEFFYEDKESIASKLQLVSSYGLKGLSVWRLGLGATDLLDYILDNPVPSGRLAGTDRYATAAAISRRGWSGGSDTVVLASGATFADALAGTSLAYAKSAPLLLTNSSKLSSAAANEITRLGAKKVYILGGTDTVSETVKNEVERLGCRVERIWGADRYKTAVEIGNELPNRSSTALVATGLNYADALAAAPFCAAKGMPVLFTGKGALNADTKAALKKWGITNVIIAGESDVVSAQAENEMKAMGISVTRIGGADRYETAVKMANYFGKTGFSNVLLATGTDFPDALAGAAYAAKYGMPIILTSPNRANKTVVDYMAQSPLSYIYVAGDAGAVSDSALMAVALPYK